MKSLKLNDLGKKFIVEECQKISIKFYIDNAKRKIMDALIKSELQYKDIDIQISTSNTYGGGIRYWFLCPLCKRRAGVIFTHPITNIFGCRTCLNLKYKKIRFKGMIESGY